MLSYEFIKAFAEMRNKGLSFSFLKENGELLTIAASSNMSLAPKSIELYTEFYGNIMKLVELYPSFYRFLLAIIQDLEALGMPGDKSEELSDYVLKNDLYAFDTSDTRRMEIINLLERSGRKPNFHADTREALEQRTHAFFNKPDRFIKFNRPLFYDLTHLVFFWTNFGEYKIDYSPELLQSLTHIGLLAFLEGDADLLSEVCLCFKFLGQQAPAIWHEMCENALSNIPITFEDPKSRQGASPADEYHTYFVINWMLKVTGKEAFTEKFEPGLPVFGKVEKEKSALAAISHTLHPQMLFGQKTGMTTRLDPEEFLSPRQFKTLKSALSCSPFAPEFFDKLTNGYMRPPAPDMYFILPENRVVQTAQFT